MSGSNEERPTAADETVDATAGDPAEVAGDEVEMSAAEALARATEAAAGTVETPTDETPSVPPDVPTDDEPSMASESPSEPDTTEAAAAQPTDEPESAEAPAHAGPPAAAAANARPAEEASEADPPADATQPPPEPADEGADDQPAAVAEVEPAAAVESEDPAGVTAGARSEPAAQPESAARSEPATESTPDTETKPAAETEPAPQTTPEEIDAEARAEPGDTPEGTDAEARAEPGDTPEGTDAEARAEPSDTPEGNDAEARAEPGDTPEENDAEARAEPSDAPPARPEMKEAAVKEPAPKEADAAEPSAKEADPKPKAKAPKPAEPPPDRPELRVVYEALANRQPLTGRVIGWNSGGFHLALGELAAFCPRSEMEVGEVEDPESYLDREFEFRVLRLQGKGRRIVVSRAAHQRREKSKQRNQLRKKLKVGAVLEGTVASLKEFGAFVDLGGAQGLVHVSEISHRRVEHPSHVLSEGQQIQVKVLKVEQGGRRISLSMRALEPDPWKDLADRFPQGAVVKGTVEKANQIGAFIELAPGLTGLLPARSMSIPRETTPARAYPPGKEVSVQIVAIDPRRQRISLALEGSGLEGSRTDYKEFQRKSRESADGEGFNALASAFRRLQGGSD